MKPKGFVAAASTTSQMSIPIRSHSWASSLTRAMLTERKMFSSSFVSSAASGVETRWTVSIALAVERGGGLRRRLVDAADDLRHRLRRVVDPARVDALGREREVEVGTRREARTALRGSAAARPGSCRGRSSTPGRRGVPCAAASRSPPSRCARSRDRAPAASRAASGARSGSRRPPATRRSPSSPGARARRTSRAIVSFGTSSM